MTQSLRPCKGSSKVQIGILNPSKSTCFTIGCVPIGSLPIQNKYQREESGAVVYNLANEASFIQLQVGINRVAWLHWHWTDVALHWTFASKDEPRRWRLGELFHHLMECKHAISTASKVSRCQCRLEMLKVLKIYQAIWFNMKHLFKLFLDVCEAGRKVAVDFLFGETKKPDTHRQCTIHMHDRWDMVGLGPCSFDWSCDHETMRFCRASFVEKATPCEGTLKSPRKTCNSILLTLATKRADCLTVWELLWKSTQVC